jgi:uncharacterized protein (TIGR02145 family)
MKSKIILTSLFIVFIALIIFVACESKPTKPDYNNVFDPGNPTTSGEPIKLGVRIGNGGITLNWTIPDIKNLNSFKIYRSEQELAGFTEISTAPSNITEYTDRLVENGHSYWYKVTAIDSKGNETSNSNISAMNINTNPVLVINSGENYTPSKEVNLTILANTAQQMMLSNSSDFTGAIWETYSTTKNWTLLTGDGYKIVYIKVKYSDNNESAKVMDSILPQPLNPEIIINNDDEYAPSINATLQLSAIGAIDMYISNTTFSVINVKRKKGAEELQKTKIEIQNDNLKVALTTNSTSQQTEVWEPYSSTKNWTLSSGSGNKTVFVKFRNDFEIESQIVSDNILPQPLTNASISIAGGAQYTSTRNVELTHSVTGDNLQMKISEDSTFAGLNWQTFTTPINFQLSTGVGVKRVYVQFKNDFDIVSPIVSDDILPQPMNPAIIIANGAQYTSSRNVELAFTVTGSNLQMKISEDSIFTSMNWQPFNSPMSYQLSTGEGAKSVYAKIKNDFEIESSLINNIITLDMTPPVPFLIVTPDSGITNETTFQFDPTGSYDNFFPNDSLQVRFDWENDGIFDTNWQLLSIVNNQYFLGGGDKTVKMQLKDGVNWTTDTTMQFFVNTRPSATFITTENDTNVLHFHFDASASFDYEDGNNLKYRWDFDGNGIWDTGWLINDTSSYLYSSGGDYAPKLSVLDLNNLTSEITVNLNVFDGTVTDIDGNLYLCVNIGNQWWMAKNLSVAHYRNGDAIPNERNNSTWAGLSTGAYCTYNDGYGSFYGKLYNWYAVSDNREIAPVGWHVPTDDEWKELERYLGMNQTQVNVTGWRGTDEGDKLKEADTTHWISPSAGNNSSGFLAIPGGYCDYNGYFHNMGYYGRWWSSTEASSGAWERGLSFNNSQVGRYFYDKHYGFSIRCIRD